MAAGRKPRPTALKVLEGNPGKRPLPRNEPFPAPIRPDCPDFLNDAARSIWNGLVDELERIGTLTFVDESALAGYCEAYEEAQTCSRFLNEYGLTMTAPSGYAQARPEVAIRNKAWDRVDKFGAQLGIGAAHRSRIEVKKAESDEDALSGIISRNVVRRQKTNGRA